MDGMAMTPPAPLGAAIGINFQPTGGGKAAITGDFVLTNDEVNPVIRALRANGIDVTAVHSHMLDEQPRLFFLHFWAVDDAMKLAKGLRAALDKTASVKSWLGVTREVVAVGPLARRKAGGRGKRTVQDNERGLK